MSRMLAEHIKSVENGPSDEEVREELGTLLGRDEFHASERNRRFLSYIVEETLQGRADRIKAYSIAIAAFDRSDDFDPLTDPIVRIEASRLRRSLEIYYLTAGKSDLVRIDMPKGSYVATFGYADQARVEDRNFVSSPGKKDGLYWEVPEGSNDAISPLLNFVTQQEGYLQGRDEGDPLRGYNFRIITRQGAGAPGGRYDYIINDNMIGGYAVIATPDDYGNSGIMTFMVNQQGKVYEKDLGDDTEVKAAAIQEYDLDSSWKLSKDEEE